MQKKFVFCQLSRYLCTRRIQFPLQNIHVVSFFQIMMTLFAALSAGAKTYLLRNLSVFLFSAFTIQLGDCLYQFGCIVKFSILILKKIHFPVDKGMYSDIFLLTSSFAICLKCFLNNIPAFSKINP